VAGGLSQRILTGPSHCGKNELASSLQWHSCCGHVCIVPCQAAQHRAEGNVQTAPPLPGTAPGMPGPRTAGMVAWLCTHTHLHAPMHISSMWELSIP
jgi:hypothetical protein